MQGKERARATEGEEEKVLSDAGDEEVDLKELEKIDQGRKM